MRPLSPTHCVSRVVKNANDPSAVRRVDGHVDDRGIPINDPPRLLLLASKMGYQTRSFAEAARRLGFEVVIGSDRCHQLDDPWSDGAIALHFERPEQAAERIGGGATRQDRCEPSWRWATARR